MNRWTLLTAALLAMTLGACTTVPAERDHSLADTRASTAERLCVRDTGTRVRAARCQPGRVYTADELRRTGEIDTQEALRRIDPSIR